MSVSIDEVKAAIASWRIEGFVEANAYGGKVELVVDGESRIYPAWLALRQVNLIGAERGF